MNYYALDGVLEYLNNDESSIDNILEVFRHLECNITDIPGEYIVEGVVHDLYTKFVNALIRIKDAIVKFFKWLNKTLISGWKFITRRIKTSLIKKKYNAKKDEAVANESYISESGSSIYDKFKSITFKINQAPFVNILNISLRGMRYDVFHSDTPEGLMDELVTKGDQQMYKIVSLDDFINKESDIYERACTKDLNTISAYEADANKRAKDCEEMLSKLKDAMGRMSAAQEYKYKEAFDAQVEKVTLHLTKLGNALRIYSNFTKILQACMSDWVTINNFALKLLNNEDPVIPSLSTE